jgi:hypothetical protein
MAVATPSIAPVTACVEISEICFVEGIHWVILGGTSSALSQCLREEGGLQFVFVTDLGGGLVTVWCR